MSVELAPLTLVVAMANNRVIGRGGSMPWHYPEDLRHFRQVTIDHAIIMGRRTWESIGRPLPRRRNIVLSTNPSLTLGGCEVFSTFEEALASARETDHAPRVIGGEVLFRKALPLATRIHLTEIDLDVDGDTFFPPFDESAWEEIERRVGDTPGLVFRTLERRR